MAVTISKAKEGQEDTIKTQEVMMKRFAGVAVILFLLLTVRVHAQSVCDYVLSFEDVSLSGTSIEDGYFFSGFSQYGYYFDICGIYTATNTTDLMYAELSDDSGVYWSVYGTMIWNQEMTRAYYRLPTSTKYIPRTLTGPSDFRMDGTKFPLREATMIAPPTSTFTRELMGNGVY